MEGGFDYNHLLKKAAGSLPKKTVTKERFVIPELVCEQHGNKTMVKNFADLLAVLRRDSKHLARYLFKELATRGSVQNNVLVLDTKISKDNLMKKIESYLGEFVNCKVCGEPDTKFSKEGRFVFMVCEACGAKNPIRIL